MSTTTTTVKREHPCTLAVSIFIFLLAGSILKAIIKNIKR